MSLFTCDVRSVLSAGEPALRRLAQLTAAGLLGFGIILLVAANWESIGTFQRFAMVGAIIAAGGLGAVAAPAVAAPALLVAFAATGGMLALIGQTYQTGADPWQLFAAWAALGLPFALAARSDALWSPWAIVAATAVSLWSLSSGPVIGLLEGGPSAPSTRLAIPSHVAVTWAFALALVLAMTAGPVVDKVLGSRLWAGRIAVLLALIQIAWHGIEAIIGYRVDVTVFIASLAVLSGIGWWIMTRADRDLLQIAATALAIDAVLIAGLARLLVDKASAFQSLGFIVLGLAAAGIVGLSAMWIMRQAAAGTAAPAEPDSPRPWPIVLLSAIGALIASIPFIVALALIFGAELHKGPLAYLFGTAAIACAYAVLKGRRGMLVEHITVVALATGVLLLAWGAFRDLPDGLAGIAMCALLVSLAVVVGRPWLAALLAAASAAMLAAAMTAGHLMGMTPAGMAVAWSIIACIGVAACFCLNEHGGWLYPLGHDRAGGSTLEGAADGWLAGSLAGLAFSQGMTFLAGGHVLGGLGRATSAAGPAVQARVVSVALAAAALIWLWQKKPAARSPSATALMVAAAVLSMAMPALGAAILVFVAALATGRRTLVVLAIAAALWIAGAFYYSLALPLTQKGIILVVTGLALGLATTFSREVVRAGEHPALAIASTHPATIMRALSLAGVVLVGLVTGQAIRAKELLIRDGRPVFVELAPVDPRSLMQGDYMALRFQLPVTALRHQQVAATGVRAIGRIDEKGVLRLTRIGDARTALDADEMAIGLSRKRGRWMLVTDAWFFREGTAQQWEAARYGELRVTPDGSALLVGLADKDLVAIAK